MAETLGTDAELRARVRADGGLDHPGQDPETDAGLQREHGGVAPADHPVRHDEGLQEHPPRRASGPDLGRGRRQIGGERQTNEKSCCQESLC